MPPQDEVTSLLRQKTRQKPYAMAMRARAGLVQRARRNDQPRERRPRPTTLRVAGASVCAVPCSVRCALCYHVHLSVRCHLFLFSRPPMNAPNRLKHDEIKKRGFADGFRERAQMQRDHDALVSSGVQNCAIVLTGRLQPRPSTDMVKLPSSVRTTQTAVGAPVLRDTVFLRMNHNRLKQQPLHGHTTQGPA